MENEHSALAIAISSGKGGVGKTNVTTNLGIALAKSGKRVCVLDGDTSLANINILLNLSPTVTLDHYLKGERSLEDVMLAGPKGMQVVPSASGIPDCVHYSPEQQSRLLECLEQLEREFDYLLVDTAAGIGEGVLQFIEAAQYAVIVISPEPTSLTDAFAMIKVLKRRGHQQPIYILVNMSNGYAHSMEVFKRFAHAVNKHIETKVRYLGYVPLDQGVQLAVRNQRPFILEDPESPAGRCITLLANILLKHFSSTTAPIRKVSQFWREQLENAPNSTLEPEPQPTADDTQDTAAAAVESGHDTDTSGTAAASEVTPEQPASTMPLATTEDMTNQVRNKEQLSQAEADDLLAQLIQHYLTEFGALPQQAIDLILQAHDQEQLPEAAVAQLRAQLPGEHPTAEDTRESSGTTELENEIDSLVAEASQTKERLTELAEHLRTQYLELYNTDINRPAGQIRAIPTQKPAARHDQEHDEKAGLKQSIQFASALDQNK